MKKLIALIAMMLICGTAFAMGSRGTYSPLGQCYVDSDKACAQYGDAWFPNPKTWTLPDGSTQVNTVYNPNKPTYDKAASDACKAPLYEACRVKYQK